MTKLGAVNKGRHVTCYKCGKVYRHMGATLKLEREFAQVEGWQTAIPEWMVRSPRNRASWLEHHKPRCLDKCKECAWQDMIKAMKALEIHESKTRDGETIN